MMIKNEKVRVLSTAKFHSGREGYFQFFGKGVSKGSVVLTAEPIIQEKSRTSTYFAVASNEIEKVD